MEKSPVKLIIGLFLLLFSNCSMNSGLSHSRSGGQSPVLTHGLLDSLVQMLFCILGSLYGDMPSEEECGVLSQSPSLVGPVGDFG